MSLCNLDSWLCIELMVSWVMGILFGLGHGRVGQVLGGRVRMVGIRRKVRRIMVGIWGFLLGLFLLD